MNAALIRTARVAVVAVAVVVAAISYTHIRDLALGYGGDWLTAPLLPLGIDGAVAAFTVFMHQASGLALWLSRFGLLVAIGMTVAFNTAYGAAFGVTGAVVWSSPAVLLVICIEVSVLMVRKTGAATASFTAVGISTGTSRRRARLPHGRDDNLTPEPREVTEPQPARLTVAEQAKRENVKPLTVKQQAAILGKHPRTVARYRKGGVIDDMLAAVSPNGKVH